jgi:hypothetical protein
MPWFVEAHILGAVLGPILARLVERWIDRRRWRNFGHL